MKISSEAVVVAAAAVAAAVAIHFCAVAAFEETLKIYENRYRRTSRLNEHELKEQFLSRNLSILRYCASFRSVCNDTHTSEVHNSRVRFNQSIFDTCTGTHTFMLWFSIRNRCQFENILSLIPRANIFHWAKCASERKRVGLGTESTNFTQLLEFPKHCIKSM